MARHNAIGKARWLAAQKAWLDRWRAPDVLERETARIERDLTPLLRPIGERLKAESGVLDLGCGPICPARLIEQGEKTWLDPMLDDFRRLFPGRLPKGRQVTAPAEKIPLPDASFDVIVCMDALDRFMNPELALHEIKRLIKPDGILALALPVFPKPLVRLRQALERFLPALRNEAHPYSYTLAGLRKTLHRHFEIAEEHALPETSHADGRWLGREYAFICRPRDTA